MGNPKFGFLTSLLFFLWLLVLSIHNQVSIHAFTRDNLHVLVRSRRDRESEKLNWWNRKHPHSQNSIERRARTYRRPDFPEDGSSKENGSLQRETAGHPKQTAFIDWDRPTETIPAEPERELVPSKPKFVVLGATGRVGRWVVRQLLESSELQAATIVAFCRDYDKACRVLYDDLVVANSKRKGPKLQIIHGDLLTSEEVFGDDALGDGDDFDEQEWLQRAQSAAKFYGRTVSDYDDRKPEESTHVEASSSTSDLLSTKALREAISGCTTIISCVGSVRPTNPWTDFIVRPVVRLLKKDVSDWCPDPRHPYYTNYLSTQKVLRFAEEEQAKRESATKVLNSEHGNDAAGPPRIRFIRISDLCVAQKPWGLVPLVANIFNSMVFRYHDMAELELEKSTLLDTVVIRPGDLVDEERPENVTLQIGDSTTIPSPSIVGHEDVASLAVATALLPAHHFARPNQKTKKTVTSKLRRDRDRRRGILAPSLSSSFHCQLGLRWAGEKEAMQPFPAQGCAEDGMPSAKQGLRKILKEDRKKRRDGTLVMIKDDGRRNTETRQPILLPRDLKPYGVVVAFSIYLVMGFLATSLLRSVSRTTFTRNGVTKLIQMLPPGMVNRVSTYASHAWSWFIRCVGRFAPALLGYKFRATGAKFISI